MWCNRRGLLFKSYIYVHVYSVRYMCSSLMRIYIWRPVRRRRLLSHTACLTSDLFMAHFRHGFSGCCYAHFAYEHRAHIIHAHHRICSCIDLIEFDLDANRLYADRSIAYCQAHTETLYTI